MLLTGGTGFVGRQLVPQLLAAGHAVSAAVRGPAPAGTTGLRLDDASPEAAWAEALRGVDALVHVAGLAHRLSDDPARAEADHRRINRDWALTIGRAARAAGVTRCLFVSTVYVHAVPPRGVTVTEATPIAPVGPYAMAKAEAEAGLREIFAEDSLVILRPPLVYGPGAAGNLARLVRLGASGLPLPFGAVANRRTLVSVASLCRAVGAVLARWDQGPASGSYVLGDAAPVSTGGMVAAIRDGLERPARLLPVPPALLRAVLGAAGKGAMAEQLLGDMAVDATAFARDFAWTPEADTLAGLRAMAASAR
ncbi:NAD-dependent epimerase/dehydratase family protein [Falsiroseomonas sp.]|uniref:NAD-dependent epimerase/dehydratase family protein n=1 Tax=Falsiroseomonas sp. TaxID=2870721 RepID=UPI0034A2C3FC